MVCMKELAQENRRLRKMYVEEKIKDETVSEALANRRDSPKQRLAVVA